MGAALLLAKGAFGFLARLPWWAYAVAALFAWGAIGRGQLRHERADRATEHQAQAAALAKTKAEALATESTWKGRVYEQHRKGEIEVQNIAAALERSARELRDRGPRRTELPGPPAAACQGATGAELSEPDGRFLVGEAARANRLRAALGECEAWIETVTELKGSKP